MSLDWVTTPLARRLALLMALLPCTPALAGSVATKLPDTLSQGELVVVRLRPGSRLDVAGKPAHVGEDGMAVFGAGRDEQGPLVVDIVEPGGHTVETRIAIIPRDWPIERINGVPPATVNPPPDLAARIEREQAAVTAARNRDDNREDFIGGFVWPVQGRISGRFGNQRIYNGDPKAPHSGMDIAVPQGTPVRAPAAGVVTFAQPDLYMTGGTVLLDHGFGLSSNFLHLSRLEVSVGQHVSQGQIIALSGMTGRATGPHLHWGFNWFGMRLDPLLLPGIASP